VVVGVVASLVEALLLGVVKTEIRHLEQGWQFPQTGEHGVKNNNRQTTTTTATTAMRFECADVVPGDVVIREQLFQRCFGHGRHEPRQTKAMNAFVQPGGRRRRRRRAAGVCGIGHFSLLAQPDQLTRGQRFRDGRNDFILVARASDRMHQLNQD